MSASHTYVQEVAELVAFGGDEADPAGRVLMLGAVLHVHLEKRCKSLEEVSEARLVRERCHAPLCYEIIHKTIQQRSQTNHEARRMEQEEIWAQNPTPKDPTRSASHR